MKSKKTMRAAIAILAVAALAYYYLCDPSSAPAPRCLLRTLTGYDCPGCGTQRALHAMLHGRVAEAWGYNPAVFFAVPLAAMYLLADRFPAPLRRVLEAPATIFAIAAAIAAWWVLRNVY